jgi:hypothetical protein
MRMNPVISNLKDAILYARLGNTFVRCGMTDGNGVYHLQSLPAGTMKIIANRFGFSGDSATVNVTSTSNIDSVNFYLRYLYVGIRQLESTVPSEYRLFQNYPNPFNPNTIIRYKISRLSSRDALARDLVLLRVYDILGKEIATLVNEKQSPGVYEVTFDGSTLPSGVYYYKLTAGDYTETKKALLVK